LAVSHFGGRKIFNPNHMKKIFELAGAEAKRLDQKLRG